MKPPLNSGVYALYCRPQCGCSCLKSVAITVIWVAPTASQVWAAITSLSFSLAALFSPNLLLADWLAVKWRFLFSSWGPYRAWQQWRRTLLRNGVEIAFCFSPAIASWAIYTRVSPTFYLTQGENTEFTKRESDMERKREEKGRHHTVSVKEEEIGGWERVCLEKKERRRPNLLHSLLLS